MLGNISKKKGDNGDFYTKPVIDKKLKDAETATKAYTDKAAADVKNDLYAEVGEKVGAVEETVKARLDSTDAKLDTKVDKVSGKGLVDETDIRTAVQNVNLYFEDGKEMSFQLTESGDTGTNVINGVGMTVGYNNMNTTIGCGSASFNFTDTKENVYITPNDVTINQGGKTVHKLSEKIGLGTTVIGSTDKIRLESADNVGPSGIEINPHFSNDIGKAFIKVGVSPTSPSKTVVGTGSITGSDMEKSFSISGNDIVCSPNSKVTHRLSQKVDKVEGKSLIDEQAAELMSGDPQTLRVHGNILTSEGEVTVMAPPTYGGGEPIEHKLTEKANMSNSSGGFAAGEGAYAYGTKEVASGEIGLLGMTDLNAIQLGTGINGQEFSVQVYDYELVVSGEERGKKSATDGKKYIKDVGKLSDLTTTDKSSIVAAINEVKSSGGGDVLDNLTYDSTNDIINSSANLLLENSASVAAYNGTFRGDIKIGQLGANKWAYRISPITGFSTSVDVTCTSGNVVHNLAAKADTTNVLTRNNTQTFTPTGDYQPATKKYVDDAIAALKLDLGLD